MRRALLALCATLAATVVAQPVQIKGVVTSRTGKPIAGATVVLAGQGLRSTTGTDGTYSLTRSSGVSSDPSSTAQDVFLDAGVLEVSVRSPADLAIEVLDVRGQVLRREAIRGAATGLYRWDLHGSAASNGILLVRARVGDRVTTLRSLPSSRSRGPGSPAPAFGVLARAAAVVDTVKVSANGYLPGSVAISSYEQTVDVVLDSAKVAAGRTAGCGKDLGSLKVGNNVLKIQSGAYQREYTVNIPANYDKNKPYRLVFAWHWINASDDAVVNGQVSPGGGANWAFYGLKRMADSAGQPMIFIAPQSRTGTWGQEDHVLFDDLLKLHKASLCVDSARVFAIGFSFGAMQTYSLSLAKQKDLRAVVTLGAANYNIYLPTNTKLPIAYLGITGMSDGTTPFNSNGRGGLYCARTHATDNGCTVPESFPTAAVGSKGHVAYDFKNCRAGYPVRYITFDGGHIAAPADGGTSDNGTTSWAPRESYRFLAQF